MTLRPITAIALEHRFSLRDARADVYDYAIDASKRTATSRGRRTGSRTSWKNSMTASRARSSARSQAPRTSRAERSTCTPRGLHRDSGRHADRIRDERGHVGPCRVPAARSGDMVLRIALPEQAIAGNDGRTSS